MLRIFGACAAILFVNASAAALEVASVTQPQAFTDAAATSLLYGIKLSNLAIVDAVSSSASGFAQRVVEERTRDLTALGDAAYAEGGRPPNDIEELQQAKLDFLAQIASARFDYAFLMEEVAVHEDAVNLFTGYSLNGPPGALHEFASAAVPRMLARLDEARRLAGR